MQNTTLTVAPKLDPSTRLALANLRAHLASEGDFSPKAITGIITHLMDGGDIDDAPFVRPEEVASLTEVYIRGFPEIPADDPSWGSPAGREHMLNPADDVCALDLVELPDAPDHHVTTRPGYWEALAADGISPLPAISGGCDDVPAEYHPTPEDWEEYRRMVGDADDGDVEPAAPDRYSPAALIAFRNAAWGV